ncbi:uncharacterized protein V6R79_014289 [Siganus canaliculatus]
MKDLQENLERTIPFVTSYERVIILLALTLNGFRRERERESEHGKRVEAGGSGSSGSSGGGGARKDRKEEKKSE